MSNLFLISCQDEVIFRCVTVFINVEFKEHNDYNVIIVAEKVFKILDIAILSRVERVLTSSPRPDCLFEMVRVIFHFGVISRINNMFPSLIGKVYCMSISVLYNPFFAQNGSLSLQDLEYYTQLRNQNQVDYWIKED